MNAKGIVFAAALLSIGSAQAQLAETPPAQQSAQQPAQQSAQQPAQQPARLSAERGRFGPLAEGFKRYQPLYGGNESANPNDRLFPGFRTDPRLVIGYAFNHFLAVEAGYSHLRDEGFHKIDPYSPVEAAVAAGALGVKSHTTYLAAKLTIPVTDRLTAYGKLGVAQSTIGKDGFATPAMAADMAAGKPASPFAGESATGAYGAIGARYKLNDRATLKGEVRMNGSADKFGGSANASAVKGSVGFGF